MDCRKPSWIFVPLFQYIVISCSLLTAFHSAAQALDRHDDSAESSPLAPSQSFSFESLCSGCHGQKGRGGVGPSLRNVDFQTFLYAVRYGKAPQMPPFGVDMYSEQELKADYQLLTGKPALLQPRGEADLINFTPLASPLILYQTEESGPQSRGLGFGLDRFVLPYRVCRVLPSRGGLGQEKVCANASISGSAEPGYRYADFGVCQDVYSQRPFKKVPVMPRSSFSDAEFLSDEHFMGELSWVTEQVRSSACVCCHDSSASKKSAYWDINQGQVWTNQLSRYAVAAFAGKVNSVALGSYRPEENFGFDRYHTALPTNDVPRMQSFFDGLLRKMNVTEEEWQLMPPLAGFISDQLYKPSHTCGQGIGVDRDSLRLNWGPAPARYIYVLEASAQTPVVPPNLDKPVGTLWRLDLKQGKPFFVSGLIRYGQVPRNAEQTIPDRARFSQVTPLQPGSTYKLVAQLDIGFPVQNCVFTF